MDLKCVLEIKSVGLDDDECRDINEAIEKEVKKAKKKEVKEEE